jgi:hypothetical protein
MVVNKTLYTLASANQNSIYIAGLRRETLYTLRQSEPKLYIHWPLATKTPYTLSHLSATMDARQVLKKAAP